MQGEKEYLTVEEVADELGVTRATVYNYMKDLNITTQKFGRDRRGYLSRSDVRTMKDYKENPWKYGVRSKSEGISGDEEYPPAA